jgi:hypothetical protein
MDFKKTEARNVCTGEDQQQFNQLTSQVQISYMTATVQLF